MVSNLISRNVLLVLIEINEKMQGHVSKMAITEVNPSITCDSFLLEMDYEKTKPQ